VINGSCEFRHTCYSQRSMPDTNLSHDRQPVRIESSAQDLESTAKANFTRCRYRSVSALTLFFAKTSIVFCANVPLSGKTRPFLSALVTAADFRQLFFAP
jgi:hypothetical protein